MASFSSTSTYPSTGTPKLKLKITKGDKKLTVQVLGQDDRFRATNANGAFSYVAQNGFKIASVSWIALYDHANKGALYLLADDDLDSASREFPNNAARDAFLYDMEEALRDWAENAPEFKTAATDDSGRIVTFKSNKAEVEFVKFEKVLAMQVKSMDERFREVAENVGDKKYTASNGLCVRSFIWPSVEPEYIDLRASKQSRDDAVSVLDFDSNADLDAYLAKALSALEDWSKNWAGWKIGEPTTCARACIAKPCPSACHHCHCCGHTHEQKGEYIFTV